MDFTMTIHHDLEEGTVTGKCALVWLSTDHTPVLTSNIASSLNNKAMYLAQILTANNTINLSSSERFLQKGVPVLAVVAVSTTHCIVTTATVNISTVDVEDDNELNFTMIISNLSSDNLIALVLDLTQSLKINIAAVVAIPVLCIVLTTVVIIFALVAVIVVVRKKNASSVYNPTGELEPCVKYTMYSPADDEFPKVNRKDSLNPNGAYNEVLPYLISLSTKTLVLTEVGCIQHNYERLDFDESENEQASFHQSIRPDMFTFKPSYGVIVPNVDFTTYNKTNRTSEKDWEYDRDDLTYLRDIGEGHFGKVLLMRAKNIAGYEGKLPVAVKTLSSTYEQDVRKFLEEIDLMKKFCHPNIVSLLGVNYHYSEGAPLMILEYMPYGDLLGFLRKHRPEPVNDESEGLLTIHHFSRFARDVACGLHFLEDNKYVHRDVAARNCLVGSCLQIKLADFGLARGVQQKDYYRIAGQAVLPVRWLAPESLVYGVFTSASDVWSYGVLLWEIVTYGCLPLKESKPHEIVEMAQNDIITHVWPVGGSDQLRGVMLQCHKYKPEDRPSFSQILGLLPDTINP